MSEETIPNVPFVQISALSPKRQFCGPDRRKEMSGQNHVLYTKGSVSHNRKRFLYLTFVLRSICNFRVVQTFYRFYVVFNYSRSVSGTS